MRLSRGRALVAAHAQSLATRRGEFLAMALSRLCLTLRALRVDEAEAGTGSGEAGGQERGSAAQRGSAEAGGAAQDVPAQGRRIAGGQGDSFDDTSSWQERGEELAAEQPYLPQRQHILHLARLLRLATTLVRLNATLVSPCLKLPPG